MHWPHSGTCLEVVGESFYRPALEMVAGNPPDKGGFAYFTATMAPESDNKHDANTVGVLFDKDMLGHLSREDAAQYRQAVGSAVTTADAVVAGFASEGRDYDYCVELFLDFDTPPNPNARFTPRYRTCFRAPSSPSVFLTGKRVTVMAPYLTSATAAACWPGAQVTAWTKPDLPDVHFFVRGSVGGRGRLAVLSKKLLAQLPVQAQDIDAAILVAGRNGVVFEFMLPDATEGPSMRPEHS
jgi:hypothetical protein